MFSNCKTIVFLVHSGPLRGELGKRVGNATDDQTECFVYSIGQNSIACIAFLASVWQRLIRWGAIDSNIWVHGADYIDMKSVLFLV